MMAKRTGWKRPLERNIDPDRKFLFIHIPKTAGTALKKGLGLDPRAAHAKYFHYRNELGNRKYESFYKIAFVRNPWDRFLSFYLYARMEENYYHSNKNPEASHYGKNRHYDLLIKASLNDAAHYLIEGRFRPLSGDFYFMAPQCDWIFDESDTLQVDYLGRYESIDEDFAQIKAHLGITEGTLQTMNASRSDNTDFRDYYNRETKQLIAKYYERDIDLLEYTF